MSRDRARLCSGFTITAIPESAGQDTAEVIMHRCGTDVSAYMTPGEARALAVALQDAARVADGAKP